MPWQLTHRADTVGAALADRHYSRKTRGATQFMPPGKALVLRTVSRDAIWGTSWPKPEFTDHSWPGAWVCSLFRNEGRTLSSLLIRDAVAATRHVFGKPPRHGMITFINDRRTASPNPGYCFKQAGFRHIRNTDGSPVRMKRGQFVLQLLPDEMPPAAPPLGVSMRMEVLET